MDIIKNIAIIFISIFYESLPFIILGSLISALIETFISNETITKIIPKSIVLMPAVVMKYLNELIKKW